MATRRWQGGVARVAQVQTYTFAGTWEVGDLVRVTVGSKTWDYAVTSTTIATFLPLFVTAFNALSSADYPEFAEITASSASPVLTFTADTSGKPFTATLTPLESNGGAADAQTIEGGGSATTGTAATACAGPNFWSLAGNWKEGAVPVNSDDVVIDEGPSILYGTDQNAVTVATLRVGPNFPSTSEIGLPWNTSPSNPANGYPEYRQARLKIGATVCEIETTSRRVRLDLTPANTTVIVHETGQPQTAGEDGLDLAVHHASAAVHVEKGSVGVNALAGDTGTVADLNVSYRTSVGSDARVRGGRGLTLTNLDQSGGNVVIENGATTITKTDGTLTVTAGAVTTLNNRGGTVNYDGAGTITTLNNKGRFLRRGLRAVTITTTTLYAGSRTEDPLGTATWTNPPNFYECRLPGGPEDQGAAVAWATVGVHKKLTVAAI